MVRISGVHFPVVDQILSLEACVGECWLLEHVPMLKFIPQTGDTKCKIKIQDCLVTP